MKHSEGTDRVNVIALIVRKNSKVLLERRKKDRKVDRGKIVIPGGHVEDTETLEQACKRELKEELDLECSDFRHVVSIPHDTVSEKQMVHYYSCENWRGVPKNLEADAIFWISIENLKCLDFEIDRRAVRKSLRQASISDRTGRSRRTDRVQREDEELRRRYPNHPIVATGAIVIHQGRLLLIRRDSEPDRDKWTVPGGVVELGERVKDAVVRETREECGLEIQVVDERPIYVTDNIIIDRSGKPEYHYVMLEFLSRVKGGRLKHGSDVKEAVWVPLGEVRNYDLTKGFRAFFERYENKLVDLSSRGM